MMKCAVFAAIALMMTVVLPTDADAKRRIRVFGGSTGGSATIVKVLELPDTAALKHRSGAYIDRGYMWRRGSEGTWIGYLGSDSRYLSLTPEGLEGLLAVAGVSELPPVPEKPKSYFWVFLLILGVVGVASWLLKWLKSSANTRAERRPQGAAAPQPAAGASGSDWTKNAEQAFAVRLAQNQAAQAAQAAQQAAPQRPSFGTRTAGMPAQAMPAGQTFGRR